MGIKSALPQILAVMVENWLLISYGMAISYPTILIGGILEERSKKLGIIEEKDVSWIGSIHLLTGVVGFLLSGFITRPFGRKRSMQLTAIPFAIAWIVFYNSNELWHLNLALAVIGFIGGLARAPFNAYVSEITKPYLRGILSATGGVAVLMGRLIEFLFGTFYDWRTCALFSCIFPIVSFVLFFFVPESPQWLLQNHKVEEARKSLAWLRGWKTFDDVSEEFDEMMNRFAAKDNTVENEFRKCLSRKSYKPFLSISFLRPLALLGFMLAICAFTGLNTSETYAISVYTTMRVPINSYLATVLLGISELAGALVCVILIHLMGKRGTIFISLTGVCLCNVLLATYTCLGSIRYLILVEEDTIATNGSIDERSWIPLTLLVFVNFFQEMGNCGVPFTMMGEVFSYETRLVACGMCNSLDYLVKFISNNTFLKMVSCITIPGTYYFQGAVGLLGGVVLYFILPETEGRTLQEIEDHFLGISKLSNKFKRKRKSENFGNNSSHSEDNRRDLEISYHL